MAPVHDVFSVDHENAVSRHHARQLRRATRLNIPHHLAHTKLVRGAVGRAHEMEANPARAFAQDDDAAMKRDARGRSDGSFTLVTLATI
jgi:hypothetical protein